MTDASSRDAPAWIEGRPASIEEACAQAARLLAESRQPLLAGLGGDIDGARAAIALSERLGGVIDHTHSAALLRDLDCFREGGVMITTPNEARARADVLLLVGDGLEQSWPRLCERLLKVPTRPGGIAAPRRIIWLATHAGASIADFDGAIEIVAAGGGATLAANLAALRARAKGRPITANSAAISGWDSLAAELKGARFGVAVWSAQHLDALSIATLNGLVRDLNATTRFSTLPLAPPDNGAGILATCGWMTGFPMRTGFGGGAPAHDPWRYEAERLARSGETDCVVWISAFGAPPPAWQGALDFIALCDEATNFVHTPRVRIRVGRPGVDHDGVLHSAETATLIAVTARRQASAPGVAQALGAIAAHLDGAI